MKILISDIIAEFNFENLGCRPYQNYQLTSIKET